MRLPFCWWIGFNSGVNATDAENPERTKGRANADHFEKVLKNIWIESHELFRLSARIRRVFRDGLHYRPDTRGARGVSVPVQESL
jgi:hypothetical protein